MRFFWIVPQPFYSVRGTPMNVRRLLETVAARGHTVDIVTYPLGGDIELPPGVRVIRAPGIPFVYRVPIGPSVRKVMLDLLLFFRAVTLLWGNDRSADRYDALHGFEEGAWLAAVLGSVFSRPFVYDMDSDLEDQLRDAKNPLFRLLAPIVGIVDRLIIRRSVAVLTVCGTLTDGVRKIDPKKPIYQIEDAPNISVQHNDEGAPAEIGKRFGLLAGELVVYTGNLESYQGIDLLVRAAPRVLEIHPETNFLIVGGELEQIRRLQLQLPANARPRVVFVGQRPEEEMAGILTAADLLVSPRSSGTNTPLKLYSYLMAGRAIVATNRAVHTQLLSPEVAVLAEASPEGLAEAIGSLLGQPERRRTLGRSARRLGEEYGPEAFSKKVDEFLVGITDLLGVRQSSQPKERR